MKTIKQCILSLLVVASFSVTVHASQESQQAPADEKEWTFLLFLNGHNNLSSFGDMNLKDMEKSGSTDQVNYIVEWGKAGDDITRRLRVEKSTNPTKVTSPTVMSLTKRDMGDYKNLIDFVRWGVAKYPAKHYFIAVWNHGSGWKRLAAQDAIHASDISYDDNTGHKITTEELGLVLAESKKIIGHNVDVYGSDACLMQMAEVASQMKDSVDYFVGSEETEPGEGWPYQPFMKKWGQSPTLTPKEVSILLSKEYAAAYSGGVYGKKSVTFSALDMSKLDAVISSTTALATHLKSLSADSLKKIKAEVSNNVVNFYYADNVDYGDFLKHIDALAFKKDSKLFTQAAADLKSLVVSVDNTSSFLAAGGLAIWVPTFATGDMVRYSNLEFSKLTGWDKFIQAMNAAQ
ncbi:MAG: clostripain-related cysteine peptidase [Pseudobdellovibrio sp.]